MGWAAGYGVWLVTTLADYLVKGSDTASDLGGYTTKQAVSSDERRQRDKMQNDTMYADMAYGTPHEPFVKGELAYAPYEKFSDKYPRMATLASMLTGKVDDGLYPVEKSPKSIPPTEDAKQRYIDTYAASLSNPVLALGLDFSRLHLQDGGSLRLGNKKLAGVYFPKDDAAISKDGDGTDAHELMHRGFYKMPNRPSTADQHSMMVEQDKISTEMRIKNNVEEFQRLLDKRRTFPFGSEEELKANDEVKSNIYKDAEQPYYLNSNGYSPRGSNPGMAEMLQRYQDEAAGIMYNRRPRGGPR